jgi:hypothetical protein
MSTLFRHSDKLDPGLLRFEALVIKAKDPLAFKPEMNWPFTRMKTKDRPPCTVHISTDEIKAFGL